MVDNPVIDTLDPTTMALFVVDVLVAFASEESPLTARGVDLSEPVATLPHVPSLLATGRRGANCLSPAGRQ